MYRSPKLKKISNPCVQFESAERSMKRVKVLELMAYEIWERNEKPVNSDFDNWETAKAQLQNEWQSFIYLLLPSYFENYQSFQRYDEIRKNTIKQKHSISLKQLIQNPTMDVLFVTHIWLRKDKPDPHNQQFCDVKAFLTSRSGSTQYAVFYDYSSIPQSTLNSVTRLRKYYPFFLKWKEEICEFDDSDAKLVSNAILKHMNELYTGTILENHCAVLNICTNDLCLKRAWPYFELACASVCAIIVNQSATRWIPRPVLYSMWFTTILHSKAFSFHTWHKISTDLDALYSSISFQKKLDNVKQLVYSSIKLDHMTSLPYTLELFGEILEKADKVYRNSRSNYTNTFGYEKQVIGDAIDKQQLHYCSELIVPLPQHTSPIFISLIEQLLSDFLETDFLYTKVTNGSDKDSLIGQLKNIKKLFLAKSATK